MDDALASSHPLDVSRFDGAFVAPGVFVAHLSLEDVAHGLEASMWVVGEANRKLGRSHVQHEEGVQEWQLFDAYVPAHPSPIAFGLLACRERNQQLL